MSWGGMVFLKLTIGCRMETEGFIKFMLFMYAALHFQKMHITQLFFNRVLGENMNLRRETYVHIHASV